jgi:hypothetical protein
MYLEATQWSEMVEIVREAMQKRADKIAKKKA